MATYCHHLAHERGEIAAAEGCSAERMYEHCDELRTLCPLHRWIERWERWGIPQRERNLLRDDLLGVKALRDTTVLQIMRARLANKAGKFIGTTTKGSESIIVLAGKCGVGKTVAATWALSRTGGAYIDSGKFSVYGTNLSELKRTRTLVVDQVGIEAFDENGCMLSQFLDVINARYSEMRMTVLCCNLGRPSLEARYGPIFARRLRDDGVYFFIGDTTP